MCCIQFPGIQRRFIWANMVLQIVHTVYMIPCYQFIQKISSTSALISGSNAIQMNPSGKNTLTVKHACACANLLRLLLRHIYLIKLNQHRVVMIKHFSPISVWEWDTDRGLPLCSKDGKAKSSSIAQRFSPSNCLSLLSLVSFPCVPLFLSFPLLSSLCLSSCLSLYQ